MNFSVLEGFLTAVLREQVFIKEILETTSQKDNEYDYFRRTLYGASKIITQYMGRGKPYAHLPAAKTTTCRTTIKCTGTACFLPVPAIKCVLTTIKCVVAETTPCRTKRSKKVPTTAIEC